MDIPCSSEGIFHEESHDMGWVGLTAPQLRVFLDSTSCVVSSLAGEALGPIRQAVRLAGGSCSGDYADRSPTGSSPGLRCRKQGCQAASHACRQQAEGVAALHTGILAHRFPGSRREAVAGAAEAARGLSLELQPLAPCLLAGAPCTVPLPTSHLQTAVLTLVPLVALKWPLGPKG